jgi:small subunit ribosomal protein S18
MYFRNKNKGKKNIIINHPIDYKDLTNLNQYITDSGKIIPGRLNGINLKMQRKLSNAIKRARYMAIIPYCERHK